MLALLEHRTATTATTVVATDRADGDVHPERVGRALLTARQLAATGRTWTMIDQVHGVAVCEPRPGPAPSAGRGDVLVVRRPGAAAAVWAADCAPIVLVGAAGGLAAVHAGWRGLAAGVLDVAVEAVRASGEEIVAAVLGPVIHPCCYAFGRSDLARVAGGVHARTPVVTARTREGDVALDVPAAVGAALRHAGVGLDVVGPCTGCDERWYSHRRRGDTGRHAVVAWTEPA